MTMYLDHFGLREAPFRITPHTEFFFDGANRGSTLDALIYAITNDEGIVKVTGEVGSGKTMLCRMLLEKLPEQVETVYLANPSLSRDELIYALADELKMPTPPDRTHLLLRSLQQHLVDLYAAGKQVVVLIDEAHAMPPESLEEVRLLSNLESSRHKLLQIVLFGQPELDAILARTEMRQLRERITHNFALEPLQRDDIGTYLMFRMRAAGYHGPDIFSDAAIRLIAGASQGLTRRINILADKALLAAYAENQYQVTPKQAKAAIRDAQFGAIDAPPSAPSRGTLRWLAATAVLLGLAGIAAAWSWIDRQPASPAPLATSAPTAQPAAVSGIVPAAVPAPPPAAPATATPAPGGADTPLPLQSSASLATTAPDARQQAFQDWLSATRDSHYVIQLLRTRADSTAFVDDFVARASQDLDPGQLRVYRLSARGQDWMGVIYGDYPSQSAAAAAMRALPSAYRQAGAYVRPVKKLRPQ